MHQRPGLGTDRRTNRGRGTTSVGAGHVRARVVTGDPVVDHGIRRLVTANDSVAAPRSKPLPEMSRAMTRTVLFDQVIPGRHRKQRASDGGVGHRPYIIRAP